MSDADGAAYADSGGAAAVSVATSVAVGSSGSAADWTATGADATGGGWLEESSSRPNILLMLEQPASAVATATDTAKRPANLRASVL